MYEAHVGLICTSYEVHHPFDLFVDHTTKNTTNVATTTNLADVTVKHHYTEAMTSTTAKMAYIITIIVVEWTKANRTIGII
jgi:hypothetical protein